RAGRFRWADRRARLEARRGGAAPGGRRVARRRRGRGRGAADASRGRRLRAGGGEPGRGAAHRRAAAGARSAPDQLWVEVTAVDSGGARTVDDLAVAVAQARRRATTPG